MNIAADEPIRGAGLKDLQKRMRKRGTYLGGNAQFISRSREIRDLWNRSKSRVIRTTDSPTFSEQIEATIRRDEELGKFSVLEHPADFKDFNDLWDLSRLMAHEFFPQVDFYWPGIWAHHPATGYCRCMIETGQSKPNLIEVKHPEPVSLTSVLLDAGFTLSGGAGDGDALLQNLLSGLRSGLSPMYLPLYPGATALDIAGAAKNAAEASRKHYESVTVPSRVVHYKSQGHTQKEISDRLGIPIRTVQTIWRQPVTK